jgi:hypothetical protein
LHDTTAAEATMHGKAPAPRRLGVDDVDMSDIHRGELETEIARHLRPIAKRQLKQTAGEIHRAIRSYRWHKANPGAGVQPHEAKKQLEEGRPAAKRLTQWLTTLDFDSTAADLLKNQIDKIGRSLGGKRQLRHISVTVQDLALGLQRAIDAAPKGKRMPDWATHNLAEHLAQIWHRYRPDERIKRGTYKQESKSWQFFRLIFERADPQLEVAKIDTAFRDVVDPR